MIRKTLLFFIALIFCLYGCSFNNKPQPSLSIDETIHLYADTYGTARMDETGEIVTENFRDGKPISVWVNDTWKKLHQLEFEKLETKILKTKIERDKAIAIVQGKIKTNVGETSHKEIYILEMVDGRWLIEDLRITDEDVSMPEIEI